VVDKREGGKGSKRRGVERGVEVEGRSLGPEIEAKGVESSWV